MKLSSPIVVNQPPYSDPSGNLVNPDPIILNELHLTYIDNPQNKTIAIAIKGLPYPLKVYEGQSYDNLGDWTKEQINNRLLAILGDDPSKILSSLFPKTLEQHPHGPGTVLSKMIKNLGIHITNNCSCKEHAIHMNEMGNDWCEQNIDTIIVWLRQEANKRKLPFIDSIGKILVQKAISRSRKLLVINT